MNWPPEIPPGSKAMREFWKRLVQRHDESWPVDGFGVRVVDAAGGGRSINVGGGSGSSTAGAVAPFAFIPRDGLRGEIWYQSRLYKNTSLELQSITGLQNPGTEDGYFTVASGNKIYLEIKQNSAAEILSGADAPIIKCDSTWDGEMFELDSGDAYIEFVRILLHEVIPDDSDDDEPRPGVTVSNGTTTLKVARVWSGDMDASGYYAENALSARRPIRYGG